MKYLKLSILIIGLLMPMTFQASERIILTIQYDEPEDWYPPVKRMPPTPIYIIQDSHVLNFNDIEGIVEIVKGDNVLFTATISNGKVEVPNSIFGEFELSLKTGTRHYSGIIEL